MSEQIALHRRAIAIFHIVIIQTLIQSYDLGVRVGRQAILLAETHLTWWLKTKTLTGKEIFLLKDTW